MADEATKTEEAPKKETRHKVPEGHVAPVQATHELKKRINPATGAPYLPESYTTQQMYTTLRAAKTNGMPVKHFHKDGSVHDEPKTEDGVVVTRPGFNLDELADWFGNRPARGSKKAKAAEGESAEAGESPSDAELSEEDELADDDSELVEAE